MAKGEKTGGRDFKPGESGNPRGRPPTPEDIKAARALDQLEFERIARALLTYTRAQIKALLKDPKTPAQTVIIARVVASALWSGDHKRLDFLMNRLVGRPKPYIPPDDTPKRQGPDDLTDSELESRLKAYRKKSRYHA